MYVVLLEYQQMTWIINAKSLSVGLGFAPLFSDVITDFEAVTWAMHFFELQVRGMRHCVHSTAP